MRCDIKLNLFFRFSDSVIIRGGGELSVIANDLRKPSSLLEKLNILARQCC